MNVEKNGYAEKNTQHYLNYYDLKVMPISTTGLFNGTVLYVNVYEKIFSWQTKAGTQIEIFLLIFKNATEWFT